MKFRVAASVCLCLVGGLASAQSPPVGVARYEVVAIIDHPDSVSLRAMHLNNRSEVAGRYSTAPECDVPEVSFVWSNGEFRIISFPGVFSTRGESVNERGFVTGSIMLEKPVRDPETGKCTPFFRHGFIMSPNGEFHTLPWDQVHSVVNNISPSGWMTGPTTPCTPGEAGCVFYGFLYNGRDEPLFFLPTGCDSTDAMDVNNRGDVVGVCHPVGSSGGVGYGYRLRNGTSEFINYPGAMNTVLSGTNSAGDIVGYAWHPDWTPGVNFIYQRDQFAVIELVGPEPIVTAMVWDINDVGTLSGSFRGADGRQRGFLARPIR